MEQPDVSPCTIVYYSQDPFSITGAEAAHNEPASEPGGAEEGAQHGTRAHLHRRPFHPLPERQDCARRVRGSGLQETAGEQGSKMFTRSQGLLSPVS